MSRDYLYAAGVLPYTLFNNNVYFLLGKSRRNGRLTTFCGKNDQFDREHKDTAAREFYEETLGAVMDRGTMREHLKTKCSITLNSFTPRRMPCYTFVVEIPFRRHYITCFNKTCSFLETINLRSPEYLEMCDIKWVCARSVLTRVRRQWERLGTLSDDAEWRKLENLCALHTTDDVTSWRQTPSISDEDADTDLKHLSIIDKDRSNGGRRNSESGDAMEQRDAGPGEPVVQRVNNAYGEAQPGRSAAQDDGGEMGSTISPNTSVGSTVIRCV